MISKVRAKELRPCYPGRPDDCTPSPHPSLSGTFPAPPHDSLGAVLDFGMGDYWFNLQVDCDYCPAVTSRLLGRQIAGIDWCPPSVLEGLLSCHGNILSVSSSQSAPDLDGGQNPARRSAVNARRYYVCVIAEVAGLVGAAGERNC